MGAVRGTVYLGVSRGLALILNLWAFGRYVAWLGDELWGAVALLLVISTIISALCDLGLGHGTLNALVKAFHSGDTQQADRVLSSHTVVSILLTSTASLIFVAFFAAQYIKGVGQDLSGVLFYSTAALTIIQVFILNAPNSVLVAKGEYGFISVVALVSVVINTAVSLWLVYTTKQPWGFMAGNMVSSCFTILLYERKMRNFGLRQVRFRYYPEEFAPVREFVRRSWLGTFAQVFSGLDKVILKQVLGQGALGVYDQAAKIPATINSTMPLAQVFPAEIAKSNLDGPEALLRTYWKVMPTTLALMMAIIFIPSAFAGQILGLFLDKVTGPMTAVFVLASLDAAFSVYGSMFSIFSSGVGKPNVATPFIWYMLIGVAALAYPSALYFGLVGVAGSRVLLQLFQFYFIERSLKRHIIPDLPVGRAIVRKTLIFSVGLLVWGAGYAINSVGTIPAWGALLLTAALSYSFMVLMVCSRMIILPAKLEFLVPKFRRA